MYELEKGNLKRFNDYIVHTLRPSYVKGFMTSYLQTEVVERILSEEKSSVTSAAQMLLQEICELEEKGWFQAFLDELREGDYTGLYQAIREWDFQHLERMRPFKMLLERVEASFTKQIKPVEVVDHLSECIIDREREEIRAISEQKGHIAGSEKLTECLKRSDKSNWFKLLKLALHACNFTLALELLDPDPGTPDSGKAVEDSDVNEETTTVCFEFREDPVNSLVESMNERDFMTFHDEAAGGSGGKDDCKTFGGRKLRSYQRELAGPAFEGKNTIICAPTGCGKTIVALAICDHHLKTKPPQTAKIVFMATKVDVYEQQYQLFQDHFSNIDDGDIRITGLCGDMGEQISMDVIVENHDIIVLTPQILVNALKRKELPSLSVFTLLIFDECHNTTGKHPYNILMANYLDAKLIERNEPLPQIVGLTASVGIGSFKNQPQAESNICQLCANLDVRVISTVKENKEELMSFVNMPEKEFVEVRKRTSDPFIAIIHNIMSNIEALARKVYDIDSLSNIQNRDYGTQKYEQWIVDVQKRCKVLQLEDKQRESQVCRALFNFTEHLRKYNDALIINEDARTKDALDYLEVFFNQVRNAGFDETERKLTEYFDVQHPHLVQLSRREPQENPKLKELKFILDEEYRNNDQTRTVLFVRTRALADAMKNWIEETDSLKFLKPGVLIGRGRKSHLTGSGMTQTSKKGVLESFKSSNQSKILIATSVADEGIDIPQCNLVLMYEYVGNVVKMIQVRGRGRAEGSRCFLISDKKEYIEKERLNLHREKIVEKAIATLQNSRKSMLAKIDAFQKEDKMIRDHVNSTPEKPRTHGSFELLCSKCKEFACFSDDLRVVQESHHIVVDRTILERCVQKPHRNPRGYGNFEKKMKMYCRQCQQDWGIIASYMNIDDLPVIKIESFVVKNCVTNQQQYFRKWKHVTFAMKEFEITDIHPGTSGPTE
ncbi:probable ATP-dependent RNA helicase DDX58 [Megalops cyprinoides]|uniref:probable ATP-dependent RNA helicase DDX58 n=1 Tax=Megalops cyprinoides TaxID=118141 RepID=UPI0018646C91|nr:probable ATP-dependent RNA helicase DDX58 [Megalops cyprinoides]